jgi:sepiapterin reductase
MRFAIITGASRGLGKALAYLLGSKGFELALIARTGLRQIAGDLNGKKKKAKAVFFDMRRLQEIDGMMDKLMSGIDASRLKEIILVNNAAVISPVGFAGDIKDTEKVIDNMLVNYAAPVVLTNAFIRNVKDVDARKAVINISTGAAVHPIAGWSLYCSSKAGLEMFSKCASAEQGDDGVKVYSVDPGVMDTEMQREIRSMGPEKFPMVGEFIEFYEKKMLKSPAKTAEEIYMSVIREHR